VLGRTVVLKGSSGCLNIGSCSFLLVGARELGSWCFLLVGARETRELVLPSSGC
jgi:hypothetical protein